MSETSRKTLIHVFISMALVQIDATLITIFHLGMNVFVNLSEINFKWCEIKPSDLLKRWDPRTRINYHMLEFLILKTESKDLDLITYKNISYDKGPKYMLKIFSKARDFHQHSTRGNHFCGAKCKRDDYYNFLIWMLLRTGTPGTSNST